MGEFGKWKPNWLTHKKVYNQFQKQMKLFYKRSKHFHSQTSTMKGKVGHSQLTFSVIWKEVYTLIVSKSPSSVNDVVWLIKCLLLRELVGNVEQGMTFFLCSFVILYYISCPNIALYVVHKKWPLEDKFHVLSKPVFNFLMCQLVCFSFSSFSVYALSPYKTHLNLGAHQFLCCTKETCGQHTLGMIFTDAVMVWYRKPGGKIFQSTLCQKVVFYI